MSLHPRVPYNKNVCQWSFKSASDWESQTFPIHVSVNGSIAQRETAKKYTDRYYSRAPAAILFILYLPHYARACAFNFSFLLMSFYRGIFELGFNGLTLCYFLFFNVTIGILGGEAIVECIKPSTVLLALLL